MRSAEADPTLRSRIRDAAIELFGARGFDAASVRAIADRAGASAALVLHHFGSKEGLRAECDAHVVTTLLAERAAAAANPTATAMQAMLADAGRSRPLLDYLVRMLAEPGEAADRVFAEFVAHSRAMIDDQTAAGLLRPVEDPETTAIVLTAYGLVPLVLRARLASALGADPLSADGAARLTLPALELFVHGLGADDRMLVAAREALARSAAPRGEEGDGDPTQDPDPPGDRRHPSSSS